MRLAPWIRGFLALLVAVVDQACLTQGATYTVSVLHDDSLAGDKVAMEVAAAAVNADSSLLSGHTLELFIQGATSTQTLAARTIDLISNNTIGSSVVRAYLG